MTYARILVERALSKRPDHLLRNGEGDFALSSTPTLTREIRTFTNWYDIQQVGDNPCTWNPRLALDALEVTQISWDEVPEPESIGFSTGHDFAINPYAQSPLATLFHELGHIALGHTYTDSRAGKGHSLREIEAEVTGFVSMAVIGAVSYKSVARSAYYVDHYLRRCAPIQESSIRSIGDAALRIVRAGGGEP